MLNSLKFVSPIISAMLIASTAQASSLQLESYKRRFGGTVFNITLISDDPDEIAVIEKVRINRRKDDVCNFVYYKSVGFSPFYNREESKFPGPENDPVPFILRMGNTVQVEVYQCGNYIRFLEIYVNDEWLEYTFER